MKLTFLFLCILIVGINAKATFRGYKLVRIFPRNDDDVKLIENFEQTDNQFDVWASHRLPEPRFDVLLSPISYLKYKAFFETHNLTLNILDNDIQKKIDEEEMSMVRAKNDYSIINKYARYSEINNFVDQIVAANPDIASSYLAGQSHERRLLKVIVLKPFQTSTRSIWIDCGIHAREWVTPATCVYTIDRLIREYRANDPKTVAIFQKYEIHIMPLVNPDGYEYSHTTYRLWRKNRRVNTGSSCMGVDLNRNFGYRWLTGGSSTVECMDVYAGPRANSEPETQAIQNALKNKAGNWDVYMNVHSYGNWWLLPFGFNYSWKEKPADFDQLMKQSKFGTDAIEAVNGEVFTIGASSDLLYINSGGSKDWAKGDQNIKYSFVLELRPGEDSDDFLYGFTLPEYKMPLVSAETYAGIKAFFYSIV